MQKWEGNIRKGHEENLKGNGNVHKLNCDGCFVRVNICQILSN